MATYINICIKTNKSLEKYEKMCSQNVVKIKNLTTQFDYMNEKIKFLFSPINSYNCIEIMKL